MASVSKWRDHQPQNLEQKIGPDTRLNADKRRRRDPRRLTNPLTLRCRRKSKCSPALLFSTCQHADRERLTCCQNREDSRPTCQSADREGLTCCQNGEDCQDGGDSRPTCQRADRERLTCCQNREDSRPTCPLNRDSQPSCCQGRDQITCHHNDRENLNKHGFMPRLSRDSRHRVCRSTNHLQPPTGDRCSSYARTPPSHGSAINMSAKNGVPFSSSSNAETLQGLDLAFSTGKVRLRCRNRRSSNKLNCSTGSSETSTSLSSIEDFNRGSRKDAQDGSNRTPRETFSRCFSALNVRSGQEEFHGEEANSQLQTAEQVCSMRAFQTRGPTHCQGTAATRRLHDKCGPETCIRSRGNCGMPSRSIHVRIQPPLVSIPSDAIRSQLRPPNIHKSDQSSSFDCASNGNSSSNLSRRFPDNGRDQRIVRAPHSDLDSRSSNIGLRNQPAKVSPDTSSRENILGSPGKFSINDDKPTRGQKAIANRALQEILSDPTSPQTLSPSTGQNDGHANSNVRVLRDKQSLHVSPTPRLAQSKVKRVEQSHRPIRRDNGRTRLVDSQSSQSSTEADYLSPTEPASVATCRRKRNRMGCSSVQRRRSTSTRSGPLVSSGENSVEQRTRTDRSSTCARALPSNYCEKRHDSHSSCAVRQHHNSGYDSKDGESTLTYPQSIGNSIVDTEENLFSRADTMLHSRRSQFHCRRTKSQDVLTRRQPTKPSSFQSDQRQVGTTSDRSVRFRSDYPAANVLLMGNSTSSLENRRPVLSLDNSERSVDQSTILDDCEMPSEDFDRKSPRSSDSDSDVDCSLLVADADKNVDSLASSDSEKSSDIRSSPPRHTDTASDNSDMDDCRLAYLLRRLTKQGLSGYVVQRCVESWKVTKGYDSTWRAWVKWCRDNEVSYDTLDDNRGVAFIADLVTSRGWTPTTAENALSHVQATLDLASGSSVRPRFFQGLRRVAPAAQLDTEETWEVNKVFRHLSTLGTPTDKNIETLRDHTAALLALRLGCRASDRARLLRKFCVRDSAKGLLVRFYNTKELHAQRRLRKSVFTDWIQVDAQEDQSVCFVAHYRAYMAATKDLPLAEDVEIWDPSSKQHLRTTGVFVTLRAVKGVYTSLSAERLSKTFSNILKDCGIHARAHSVRAAVANDKLRSGQNIHSVLTELRWSGHNTLLKSYLKAFPKI